MEKAECGGGMPRVMLQKLPWLLWNFGLVNISRPQYIDTESEALADKHGEAKQKQTC